MPLKKQRVENCAVQKIHKKQRYDIQNIGKNRHNQFSPMRKQKEQGGSKLCAFCTQGIVDS